MPCPTCDATMSKITDQPCPTFHCERCGTMKCVRSADNVDVYVPKLVERVRDLRETMKAEVGFHAFDQAAWHQLGILEAIFTLQERSWI